jgi:cytochrome c oxidase subunit 3
MAAGEGLTARQDYAARLARARIGLKLLLIPVGLLFVVLTVAYMARQGYLQLGEAEERPVHGWGSVRLPNALLAFNTSVLLISTLTMEALRRASRRAIALVQVKSIPGVSLGEEKRRPWLAATVALGLLFLAGQWQAWRVLAQRGFYVATNPSSSFTYLLTGVHAVHLAGGILGLLWIALPLWRRRAAEQRSIRIEMLAWYWHFMALLWIYVLGLLEWGG